MPSLPTRKTRIKGTRWHNRRWDHLFHAIREGIPFTVKLDEAVEVKHVISAAREGSVF
jgi:hypothetical protein